MENDKIRVVLTSSSPAAMPSSATMMGEVGNHLFKLRSRLRFLQATRASLIAAHYVEQHREAEGMAGGVFFFGFFLLDKQKKEPRLSAETDAKHAE